MSGTEVGGRKRRKLRKITLAQTSVDDAPLDLRQNTILNPREKVVGVEVDNPNNPEEKIVVWRSTRDPLSMMYAAGSIDGPQRLAGEHWRECYRMVEIGGVRGQDTTREYVDTSPGCNYERISDKQIKAWKDLTSASQALRRKHGTTGEWIVDRILGDGLFPKQIAELMGYKSERMIRFYAERFREALQTLAITFTYCS